MRDDQYQKLKLLQEKIVDVVIVEADPASWSGVGKSLHELSRDDRGDRYWSKKNASASLTILMKLVSLTGHIERNSAGAPTPDPLPDGEADLDREVRQAEKEATKILQKLEKRATRGRAN